MNLAKDISVPLQVRDMDELNKSAEIVAKILESLSAKQVSREVEREALETIKLLNLNMKEVPNGIHEKRNA